MATEFHQSLMASIVTRFLADVGELTTPNALEVSLLPFCVLEETCANPSTYFDM
jgi:hypothetical protein